MPGESPPQYTISRISLDRYSELGGDTSIVIGAVDCGNPSQIEFPSGSICPILGELAASSDGVIRLDPLGKQTLVVGCEHYRFGESNVKDKILANRGACHARGKIVDYCAMAATPAIVHSPTGTCSKVPVRIQVKQAKQVKSAPAIPLVAEPVAEIKEAA